MSEAVAHTAVVSRPSMRADEPVSYLMLSPQGQAAWTNDPSTATSFISMREAMRAAMRLPSNLRAFGLLRDVEVALSKPH